MNFGEVVLVLAVFSLFELGSAKDDFAPRCRAGICDDRPECPRTSCACIYPSRVDCAVYYQCVGGKPTQYRCSPGLLMNPQTLTCDYDFNVNCSIGKTTTTMSTNSISTSTIESVPTVTESLETTTTPQTTTSTSTSPSTTQVPTIVTTLGPYETTTESPETTSNDKVSTPEVTEESTSTYAPTTTTKTSVEVSTTTQQVTTVPSPTTIITSELTSTTTEPPTKLKTTASPEQTTETTTELFSPSVSETTTQQSNNTTTKQTTVTIVSVPTPAPSFKCPEYYGLFPDPKNCRRFYHCSHDIPYHKWCPSNLHFNPHLLVCDWPYHAGCESFPTRPPPSTITPRPPPKPSNGTCDCDCCIIPVSSDCRSFILCINGQPFEKQCQHGLYFNPMTGTCDKPENVDCKPEIPCPADGGRFPFPDSCSYFIDCRDGVQKIKKCPEGLNYDDISQTCDWSGTCQGIPDPPPTPLTPVEDANCTCDYCFEKDRQDCSSYLLCRHQKLYKGKCADGLLFNEDINNCDYDYNVKCQVTDPPFIYCPAENGYFPYPGQCGLYIHCVQWTPIIKQCPGNLHFDPHKKHCDYPWNAGCSSDMNPTTTPGPTPSTTACDCDCCIEPDPEDCSAFTICIDKVGIRRRCSSGLLFNPTDENCDFEENVQCIHPTDQPVPECSEDEGLKPYPDDCSKYFKCIGGYLHVKSCPSNLHFNPQKKICDWPEKAGCSGGPTVSPPTLPPYRPCDVCESCYIPDKYDCAAYTYCNNGTASGMRCSEGLFFNPDIEDCDIASNVNCPGLPTDDCPEPSGLYPTDDCDVYILCSNGVPYRKHCPPGLYFNVVSHACDWPENVDCGAKPTPPPTPSPIRNCSCDCCFIPDENDCSKFYLCLDNIMTEGSCSDGLLFNRETENCDFAANVDCEEPSPICETPDGLFPNPEDCSTFYSCSNGIAHKVTCSPGLHFSKDLKQCETPCLAKCDDQIDCSSTTTTTTTVSPYCKEPNGFSPNPIDCGSFYQCTSGHGYLMKCPNGLHFSEEDRICERPCDALCDLSIDCRPTTTSTTTTTPTPISPYCKEPNGLNPNPDDCGSFYQCSYGNAYLVKCPAGLHFSVEHKVCERPCDAQCDVTIDCKPTTTSTTTITPKPISPYCKEPNGLNPNPGDCGSFYQCSNGNAYLVKCPNGLHFSAQYKVCERPCDAQCDLTIDCKPTTTPSTTTTSKPVSPYCLEPNGLNPNLDDCGSFYQCSNGNAYLVKCPNGLHFSAQFKVCQRPCDAQCDLTIDCKPTTTSTTTTPKPISPYCQEPNGLNPNPDDCGSFYQCSNGNAYLVKCPNGLHFSALYKVCERPCDAQCDLTIDCKPTTTPSTTTTPKPISPYCQELNGLNPNPDDCGSFYQCANGNAYLVKCPNGLHFSAQYKVCQRPCDAQCDLSIDCKPTTTSTTTTTTTTPKPISPYCKDPNGLNPNPDDCGSFYQCSNGNAYLVKCPQGLHFSAQYKVCERPCDAHCDLTIDCTPTTTTVSSTTTTTPKPVSPYCKKLDGLNPNPEDCGSFYQCSNGNAYLIKCPDGLHFSAKYEVCERPCDAKCDQSIDCRPTTTTTLSSTTTTTPKPVSPYCKKLDGLNPNPEDCESFYQCSNGNAYLIKCPDGLHFSAKYEVCERPCDAKCDQSIDCRSTTTTSTPEIPVSPYCEDMNGVNPNPDDCGSFYHCSNGEAHLVKCPEGLHFSAKDEFCERPCDARCDPSVECPVPPENCTCEACYLPDPADCSAYYHCNNGQITQHFCPHGLLFNKATRLCDYEENVECIPAGDPAMCLSPNGVFPFPGDCQKYVYCENNIAYVMSCSPGEEFDHSTGECKDGYGDCGPSSVSPHCPTPTGLFPHENNCSLFYHCDHGIAYLKDCPKPLYFNPQLEVCDWPVNVDCGQGSTVTTTTSSTTSVSDETPRSSTTESTSVSDETPRSSTTESTSVTPEANYTVRSTFSSTQTVSTASSTPVPTCYVVPGVICPCACRVPTYDDCSTFYQCQEDGTACKKSCPLGLYFNKRKMVCDLPKNVECRDFYFSMQKQQLYSRKSSLILKTMEL